VYEFEVCLVFVFLPYDLRNLKFELKRMVRGGEGLGVKITADSGIQPFSRPY